MADIEITRVPRIDVKKAGTLVGTRPAINLIEGANVTLTVADDSAGNEVDVTIAASGGSATPSDFQPAIVTDRYYYSSVGSLAAAAFPQADELLAWPIWFSHTVTWTRIGVYISAAAAGKNMRFGIYANGADNTPGTLVADLGTIALDSTGAVELTISQSLTANTMYWLACVHNDNAGFTLNTPMYSGASDTLGRWALGMTDPDNSSEWFSLRSIAHTYGALPNPFGTSTGGGNCPAIWLRKV